MYCFKFTRVFLITPAHAATNIPFTIAMSEAVNVTGSPRIAVDVGGVTRYATYTGGTGTSSLTFTYAAQAGDVDLDGVTLSSPIDLNGGTITDLNGNPETDLTFTVPNTSGIKIDYPSLSMDFIADADGRYTLNGTAYNDLPSFLSAAGGTYTRNSIGTYYDASGTLQTAAANTPRFNYDPVTHAAKGILIEESRTNYVVNSEFNGAAVSGGVITGMNWPAFSSGINTEITAVGTLNGEKYIEFHIYGTNSSGAQYYPYISLTSTQPAASVGQNWTASMNVLNISGTGINLYYQIAELDSSNGYLGSTDTNITNAGRTSITRTLSNASTAKIRFILLASMPNGSSIDRVIRFSVPQLELSAFPTSYIPTTTTAVTRQTDSLSFNTSGWFNAAEGQLFASVNPAYSNFSNYPQIALFGNGTSANFIAYTLFPGNTYIMEWKQSASTLYSLSGGTVAAGTETKLIGAYKNNSSIVVKNGATVNTSAATINSLPITQFSIGSNLARGGSDGRYSGTISNLKYYPVRTTTPQLQLLTQ